MELARRIIRRIIREIPLFPQKRKLKIYPINKSANTTTYCSFNNDNTIYINKIDIIKSFLCVGYPKKYYGYWNEIRKNKLFKIFSIVNLLETFTEQNREYFYLKDFIYELDQSEKVNLSYELGMIFAHLLSEYRLNIIWTFHLGNAIRKKIVEINGNNRKPDLIGYDNQGRYHIIEAKGTVNECRENMIENAINQVNSISYIRENNREHDISSRNISYFIGKKRKPLKVMLIDPKNENNNFIKIDKKKLILDFYKDIFEIIYNEKEKRLNYLDKFKFEGFMFGPIFLGLEKEIYEELEKSWHNSKFLEEKFNNTKIENKCKELINYKKKKEFYYNSNDRDYSLSNSGILIKINQNYLDCLKSYLEFMQYCLSIREI